MSTSCLRLGARRWNFSVAGNSSHARWLGVVFNWLLMSVNSLFELFDLFHQFGFAFLPI